MRRDDDSRAKTDFDRADVLNVFFEGVFTCEDNEPLPAPPKYEFTQSLNDFKIADSEVMKLLHDLKPHKAAGPANLNPLVLSKCADILAPPIAHLFRLSLENSQVPNDWKKTNVTPVYKKKAVGLILETIVLSPLLARSAKSWNP